MKSILKCGRENEDGCKTQVFSNNPCISEYAEKEKPNNNICKIDIANDEARCYVLVNNTYEIKILITFELHIKIILKAFYNL